MIVPDVNVLLHAMNADSEHHEASWSWWASAQQGPERIGLAWHVCIAYVRLMTNPRIMPDPAPVVDAIDDLRRWMASPLVDALVPGPEHLFIVERLMASAGGGGDLIPDSHLAALAFENGGTVYSQDADFARFDGVRWVNPLR